MKHNSKTFYFILVILASFASICLFLYNLRSNNRKFNSNVLFNTFSLYMNHLENITKIQVDDIAHTERITKLSRYSFPFGLKFTRSTGNIFGIHFHESDNTLEITNLEQLNTTEYEKIASILSVFSLYERNITSNKPEQYIISNIKINNHIGIYKHINLFFLIHEEEETEYYKAVIPMINNYHELYLKDSPIKIFLKFIFYDKYHGVVQAKNLYEDLKNLNSKFTLEELNDEESMNILLFNQNDTSSSIIHNEDINNDIFILNLKSVFNERYLSSLINYYKLDHLTIVGMKSLLASSPIDNQMISELVKIINSEEFSYYQLLLHSLNNLEKINKIFPVYESIRTLENVKEKVITSITFIGN